MAIDTAKRMNDELALMVEAHPKQFMGFAALPLQDVRAACDELDRCISNLGFKGVLINGYSNIGDMNTAQYLDEAPVWDFWARVEALGVPVYLHPRPPLMNQRRAYEGYEAPVRLALGFRCRNFLAHAASDPERAVRPLSPDPGYSRPHGRGTSVPAAAGREWLRHMSEKVRGKQQKPVTAYLRENFYITTAGHFRTQALIDTLLEVGSDRVLYSVDYPYETVKEQNDWFDALPISETDRRKIARENALRLLRLESVDRAERGGLGQAATSGSIARTRKAPGGFLSDAEGPPRLPISPKVAPKRSAAGEFDMDEPIHIAITVRVRKPQVAEFERALTDYARQSLAEPGARGVHFLYPPPGSASTEYGLMRSFANAHRPRRLL